MNPEPIDSVSQEVHFTQGELEVCSSSHETQYITLQTHFYSCFLPPGRISLLGQITRSTLVPLYDPIFLELHFLH